jgi:hypothetical protein
MRTPRSLGLALTALAALSTLAAADDVFDILAKAKRQAAADTSAPPPADAPASAPRSCTDGLATAAPSKFCGSVKDCQKFCSCACTFDPHKWKAEGKNDGSTTCPGAPATGPGMIPPDSPDLQNLSDAGLQYITFSRGERAAPAAIDGLRRLDAHLAASADRQRLDYKVRVVSCYRPQLDDTEPECGYVLKGLYMLARVPDAQKPYWLSKSDPNNLGLAWPGATPHSGGFACDLVLVDRRGQDSFDSRAGVDVGAPGGPPTSSIPQRDASRMLDREVTNADVGGRRLNFEAWHYEWGTTTGSRCVDPDCANSHWPVAGKP